MDYLAADPAIDGKKVAVVGHSRMGKTAIVAAALDQRFASSAPGGLRRHGPARVKPELDTQPDGKSVVETLKRINASFPHWFDDVYKQFVDEPARAVRSARIARPSRRADYWFARPTEDLGRIPRANSRWCVRRDPVYRLVAGDGLGSDEMPPVGKLQPSRLSFFIRPGKHSMTKVDCDEFLDYADKWMK